MNKDLSSYRWLGKHQVKEKSKWTVIFRVSKLRSFSLKKTMKG